MGTFRGKPRRNGYACGRQYLRSAICATRSKGPRGPAVGYGQPMHLTGAVPNRGRANAATVQRRGTTDDHGTRARALGPSGLTMIIASYLMTLWAVLFVSCGPTVAQSVAVFDFELIDTSLEGAIRGARTDEQERLARLSDQLRQLLRDSGRFSLVDITPIAGRRRQATCKPAVAAICAWPNA